MMLYSSREYKKTRVRYFVDEYEQYQASQNQESEQADSLVQN